MEPNNQAALEAYAEGEAILFASDNPAAVARNEPFNLTFFTVDNMGVVPGVCFTLTGADRGPASGKTDGCGRCVLTGFKFFRPGEKVIRADAVIGGVPVHSAHRMTVAEKESAPGAGARSFRRETM